MSRANKKHTVTDKEYVISVLSQQQWDDEESRRAYSYLMQMPKQRIVPLLLEALRDPDEYVRIAACDTLNGFSLRSAKVLAALTKLAEEDSDLQVRMHANMTIRHLRGEPYVPPDEDADADETAVES